MRKFVLRMILRNLYLHSWTFLLPFSEPLARCWLIMCYWWFCPNKTKCPPCLPGIPPPTPCLRDWNFKGEASKPLKFSSSSKLTSICCDLVSLTCWGLLMGHSGFLWAMSLLLPLLLSACSHVLACMYEGVFFHSVSWFSFYSICMSKNLLMMPSWKLLNLYTSSEDSQSSLIVTFPNMYNEFWWRQNCIDLKSFCLYRNAHHLHALISEVTQVILLKASLKCKMFFQQYLWRIDLF